MKHNKVKIHKTHPNLYYAMTVLSLGCIALAANFWTSNPTFNPYHIPKNVVGVVFFALGIGRLMFISIFQNLAWLRRMQALTVMIFLFWGGANIQQWVNGKASLQLPILYAIIAAREIPLLLESPINPVMGRKQ